MKIKSIPLAGWLWAGIQLASGLLWAAPLSPLPVGWDAYLQWERWPEQRIGARAYMRSTYDRQGGNRTADASHFLYQTAENFNVTLDVEGAGILYFARYNHWHGSPWHYEVDGRDYRIAETATADPLHAPAQSEFIPAALFPKPLAWTYADTRGADLSWVPIPFARRFRMAYSRTFYGTGYYIYGVYLPGRQLSRPIRSWTPNSTPDPDALELLNRSGSDIAPQPNTDDGRRRDVRKRAGALDLGPGETVEFLKLGSGPRVVRALKLDAPASAALAVGRCVLRVNWDGRRQPSIDAPVALFFGTGTLYNRDHREYLVKAFPMTVRFEPGPERAAPDGRREASARLSSASETNEVELACYFPMPFFRSAQFALHSTAPETIRGVRWEVRTESLSKPPEAVGYFHATYRDHGAGQYGRDNIFLDTANTEGGGDWSGSFVGTSFIFTDQAILSALEGDPRFFFDDSQTPQAQGTGSEEWAGGGDYWGGRTMSLPLAGHPVGARRPEWAQCAEDKIHSEYRFLLADLMPFGKRALIQFEHGGLNESTQHYQSVTYWYGAPTAALEKTDQLNVGNRASEQAHRYHSPNASPPYEIVSRYEWGPDHLPDPRAPGRRRMIEIFPAHREVGRATATFSEFDLRLRPDNLGVLLRRTLDYQFPNQRARVYVSSALPGERPKWESAGVWYLAGANTCYHSYPKGGELAKSAPEVIVSNRRFRDDEFLLPLRLTQTRKRIRVRIEFAPVKIPLLPGRALPDLKWSEIRYESWCYVRPKWKP